MDVKQTTALDTANMGRGASGRTANAEKGTLPLPQQPSELAQWQKHDASNYDFAASLIQRRLVAAHDKLSAEYGPNWMFTRQSWSHDLAAEIARGLKSDGSLFPQHYTDTKHSTFPVRIRVLSLEDIAELGFDVSTLTHEDVARFAYSLVYYGGDIKRTAVRELRLTPLVSRERIGTSGFDDTGLTTDEALLNFSAEVHEQMAGFDPVEFPRDFEAAICSVAEGKFRLPTLIT